MLHSKGVCNIKCILYNTSQPSRCLPRAGSRVPVYHMLADISVFFVWFCVLNCSSAISVLVFLPSLPSSRRWVRAAAGAPGSGGAGGRECAQNAERSIRSAGIILKHLLLKKPLSN